MGFSIVLGFPLQVASIFLDLVCSVYVVTILTSIYYGFMISFESGFHISGPGLFSIYSYHTDEDLLWFYDFL